MQRKGASGRASAPDREQSTASFVRRRRNARNLNQAELAELAGVGRRLISDLEGGKQTLRMDAVNAVLAVFGKTLGVVDAPRSRDDDDER